MNERQAVNEVAQAYCDGLALNDAEEPARYRQAAEQGGLLALHDELSGEAATDRGPSRRLLDSVVARLRLGWGDLFDRAGVIAEDHQGRDYVQSTPPIVRTRMVPEPWHTNILRRGWRRMLGRTPPRRQLEPSPQPLDEARWRRVAALRRAALLLLMLGQTAFATWEMSAVLPYQGWSLVVLQDVFVQPLGESARQILPYVVQTSILLLFALLFCWVSVGFWTALMGFFQLLRGKDRYSISASSPGNEPIPDEARTALVMPIANEDVSRVFAGLRATYESLKATGELEHFDIFVLSDSNDPDTCVAEQKAWVARWMASAISFTAVVGAGLSARAATSMTSAVAGAAATAIWWCWTPTV